MSNFIRPSWKRVPPAVRQVAQRIADAGFSVYLVGGALRDQALDRPTKDYDLASAARPDELGPLFERVIATGLKHGTVTVLADDKTPVEITTFRSETGYSDGRHPDAVHFVDSIEQDLLRRDFTINAMALDLRGDRLVDPHGGRQDLANGRIRTVGRAADRFGEDALRLMRAVRFAAVLAFDIEADTLAAITRCAGGLAKIAVERVAAELNLLLLAPRPSRGLSLMARCGLLSQVLPELDRCRGQKQNKWHTHDVFEHILAAVDASEPRLDLRLAALLHDIGKPLTARGPEGEHTFYHHEAVGAELADKALRRLRYSKALREDVAALVAGHMWHYTPDWSDGAVRRFMARVGEARMERLFLLREADLRGRGQEGLDESLGLMQELRARIQREHERGAALKMSDLCVGGREVMAWLDLPPGPRVGAVMRALLQLVTEHPELNNHNDLMKIALKDLGSLK